jgi:hypothetical protein
MEYATVWCSVQEESDNKTTNEMAHPHVHTVTEEELQGLMVSTSASVSPRVRTVTEEELQGLMESAPASVSTIIW